MIAIDMPMPESCVECRFSQGGYMYCHAKPENFCGYVNYCEEDGKPEWCPLKAQEPRVMTLEEVRDEADHMYFEIHSKTGSDLYGCAIRGDWDGYGIELLMGEYDTARERWSDYGKAWRCWTSRPTDEQREVTPW